MGLQECSVDKKNRSKPPLLIIPTNLKHTHEISIYPALPPQKEHFFSAKKLSDGMCQEAQDKGNGGVETSGMTLDVVVTGRQRMGEVGMGSDVVTELVQVVMIRLGELLMVWLFCRPLNKV